MNETIDQLALTIQIVLDGTIWHADWPVSALASFSLWFTGCVIASLAGLIADRLPGILKAGDDDRTAWYPPSSCDGCGRAIPLLDLVPVIGWLACRGRCRTCGHGVSKIYPLTEFAIGLASAIIPPFIGDAYLGLAALILFWSCVVIVWCDVVHHIIPEFVTIPMIIVGLLWSPISPDHWDRIAGCVLAGSMMWLVFIFVSQWRGVDAFSGGDVALLAAGGAWLGLSIVPAFLVLSGLAFLGYGITLRRNGVVWVPMGPAIAAALTLCALAPQFFINITASIFV